jgi:hypothetical protein
MTKYEPYPLVPVAEELADWYWQHGCLRADAYHIPLADWVAPLCRIRQTAGAVEGSQRQLRPAMAIWGPSQTGKSTSVSAYMDAGAAYTGDSADADGLGSGLHWEGGPGFFFMAPLVDDPEKLPAYLTRKVLNPYNKGMDGSSCLTRFTAAAIDARKGLRRVAHPTHPVEMHFVPPRDLLHALGCGYASECVGPGGREPRRWNLEAFDRTLKLTRQRLPPRKGAPRREAFERLFDLAEVLLELAETPGGSWSALSEDMETFRGRLRAMIEDTAFLHDPGLVDELAAALLWEGQSTLTGLYRKMRDTWLRYCGRGGLWYDKPVYASLEAAALFLNMGACVISYRARQPENSPEGILQRMIDRLGWREEESGIFIDCAGGQMIGGDPERFSIFQGLVWELIVPVNMDNLPDQPFPADPARPNALKRFLEEADILDFPGVGNETKSLDNRIILDPLEIERVRRVAAAPDASNADKEKAERVFSAPLFFKEIVKRGKTASIVATYARRLNIDGFSIFQGIRGYACPNADQLIHGVKSWWRHAAPEYAANPVGPSPLPLNIVLTWWATQLNKAANPNDSNIYGVIEGIVSNLGALRDPETATTFALHYHYSPDRDFAEIKHDFNPGSRRYENLMKEPAFARQFQQPVSRKSFDLMITDPLTGGAEFFFMEALRQLRAARESTATNRPRLLQLRHEALAGELQLLCKRRHLRPVPRPKDERRDRLLAFREQLRERLRGAANDDLKAMNHALRRLLDVRYEPLDPVPAAPDPAYIEAQLSRWTLQQAGRWDLVSDGMTLAEGWKRIGLDSREDVQALLEALWLSIRPDFPNLARWLEKVAAKGADLAVRRLFAIRLQNALCYTPEGARVSLLEDFHEIVTIDRPGYTFFIAPWIEPGGTLDYLINREIHPVKRPDQPGDREIDALGRKLGLPPAEN